MVIHRYANIGKVISDLYSEYLYRNVLRKRGKQILIYRHLENMARKYVYLNHQ